MFLFHMVRPILTYVLQNEEKHMQQQKNNTLPALEAPHLGRCRRASLTARRGSARTQQDNGKIGQNTTEFITIIIKVM